MSLPNTHYGPLAIRNLMDGVNFVYFLGIGGVSMASLAMLSLSRGLKVEGSDRTDSERIERLRENGIEISIGEPEKIPDGVGLVVYTVAVSQENLQYRDALARGIPTLSRADYLGYMMSFYRNRVGIAGMHGKTTCTAMTAQIFLHAKDPTVLCGAELPSLCNQTCRIGTAFDDVIFEACEYKDSFLDFCPNLAVVLNIGMDHVDYFHDMEQIHASFCKFANLVGEDGALLMNLDDEESGKAFAGRTGKTYTFSAEGNAAADFFATGVRMEHGVLTFTFHRKGADSFEISLHACGRHNVINATAAAAAASICGVGADGIQAGLLEFAGASRRMEYRGKLNGAFVYDDYAHHPDEIKATLAGAKGLGFKRVLCAYQPHTYSRTFGLFDAFAGAFGDADSVYFQDIYAAREQNESGVSSEQLAKAVGEKATYCGSLERLADRLKTDVRAGDLLLIMGAGDIEDIFSLPEFRLEK